MELILIRHGESEGNKKHLIYGHTDYPLTEKGRKQIPYIVESLGHYKLTQIISSPLLRAKAIGEGIEAAFAIPLVTDDRLKEIYFGKYEDVESKKVMALLGDTYYQLIGFLDNYQIPEGENQKDFLLRVQAFIDELLLKEDGTYVLTTHFGVIKGILNYLMGYDKKQLRAMAIKPGAVIKLSIKKDRVRLDELIQTYDRVED